MKLKLGDYYIESEKDDRCFTVYRLDTVTDHRMAKAENIGKDKKVILGYPSTINSAVKFICQRALIENDDLDIILNKIDVIQSEIEAISKRLNIRE